jgi:hypothetical protein
MSWKIKAAAIISYLLFTGACIGTVVWWGSK